MVSRGSMGSMELGPLPEPGDKGGAGKTEMAKYFKGAIQ